MMFTAICEGCGNPVTKMSGSYGDIGECYCAFCWLHSQEMIHARNRMRLELILLQCLDLDTMVVDLKTRLEKRIASLQAQLERPGCPSGMENI